MSVGILLKSICELMSHQINEQQTWVWLNSRIELKPFEFGLKAKHDLSVIESNPTQLHSKSCLKDIFL